MATIHRLRPNSGWRTCGHLHRRSWQLLSAGVFPDLPAERRRRRAPEQLQAHQLSRRAWNARRFVQRFLVRRLLSIWPHELHVRAAERHFDGPAWEVGQRRECRSDHGSGRSGRYAGVGNRVSLGPGQVGSELRAVQLFRHSDSGSRSVQPSHRRASGRDQRADRRRQLHRPARRTWYANPVGDGRHRHQRRLGISPRTAPAESGREFKSGDMVGFGAPTRRSMDPSTSTNSLPRRRSRSSSTISSTTCRSALAIVSHGTSSATAGSTTRIRIRFRLSSLRLPTFASAVPTTGRRAPRISRNCSTRTSSRCSVDRSLRGSELKATDYGCIAQFQAAGIANPVGRKTPSNPSAQYNGFTGGNPNLVPEVATTKTVGVVLQPRFIPRFAFTVDYWNIDLKKAIQGFGPDTIFADCVANSTASAHRPVVRTDPPRSGWVDLADQREASSTIFPTTLAGSRRTASISTGPTPIASAASGNCP